MPINRREILHAGIAAAVPQKSDGSLVSESGVSLSGVKTDQKPLFVKISDVFIGVNRFRSSGLQTRGFASAEYQKTSSRKESIFCKPDKLGNWYKLSFNGQSAAMHGAIGDGKYHPLSERYNTLSAAQRDYPHALRLNQSIDWAAIQSMVDTGFFGLLIGEGPDADFVITDTIRGIAAKPLRLAGSGRRQVAIRATDELRGFIIDPRGAYELSGFSIYGTNRDGQYGIGSIAQGVDAGGVRIDDVGILELEGGIYFGAGFQHPLGLVYSRLYIQAVRTFAVSIGGQDGDDNKSFNGESAYSFSDTVILTNANTSGIEYPSVVIRNKDGDGQDYISWSDAQTPLFGYLVLRSSTGLSDWHSPPDWGKKVLTSRSFKAMSDNKVWHYKVVRMTVGAHVRRAKSVSCQVLQSENFGIGVFIDGIDGFTAAAVYYENSDNSHGRLSKTPRPNLTAIWALKSRCSIDQIWAEHASYAIVVSENSFVTCDNISASRCLIAAIGQGGGSREAVSYKGLSLLNGTPRSHHSTEAGRSRVIVDGTIISNEELSRTFIHPKQASIALSNKPVPESSGGRQIDRVRLSVANGIGLLEVNTLDVRALLKSDMSPPLRSVNNGSDQAIRIDLGLSADMLKIAIGEREQSIIKMHYAFFDEPEASSCEQGSIVVYVCRREATAKPVCKVESTVEFASDVSVQKAKLKLSIEWRPQYSAFVVSCIIEGHANGSSDKAFSLRLIPFMVFGSMPTSIVGL